MAEGSNRTFARCVYFSVEHLLVKGKTTEVPEHIDYDRWQIVPRRPFQDNLVHYNWHWVWFYGNGKLGNNGIHSLDIARWALNVDFPRRLVPPAAVTISMTTKKHQTLKFRSNSKRNLRLLGKAVAVIEMVQLCKRSLGD